MEDKDYTADHFLPNSEQQKEFCREKLKPVKYLSYISLCVIFLISALIFVLCCKIPTFGILIGSIAGYISITKLYNVFNSIIYEYEDNIRKKYKIPDYIE